jgi:hypothetical protein
MRLRLVRPYTSKTVDGEDYEYPNTCFCDKCDRTIIIASDKPPVVADLDNVDTFYCNDCYYMEYPQPHPFIIDINEQEKDGGYIPAHGDVVWVASVCPVNYLETTHPPRWYKAVVSHAPSPGDAGNFGIFHTITFPEGTVGRMYTQAQAIINPDLRLHR